MQTNLNMNNQPAFGIAVSDRLIKAAHNYYNGVEYATHKSKAFDERVKALADYGYDEFKITYKKVKENGKNFHILNVGDDNIIVPFTKKDKLRKILDKFMYFSKYELYVKIKQFRLKHPELKKANIVDSTELK